MTERTTTRLAWSLAALAVALVVVTATLVVLNRRFIHSTTDMNLIELIIPVGFAAVGAVVTSRRPDNPIGWLFLVIAVIGALPGVGQQFVLRDLQTGPGLHPATPWLAWIDNWVVTVIFPTGAAMFVFLLFPTGRLLSKRWRLVAWGGVAFAFMATLLSMLEPDIQVLESATRSGTNIANPIGVEAVGSAWDGPLGSVLWLGGMALLATAVVSTVLRFRRSQGVERQQMKWFASAAAVAMGSLAVLIVFYATGVQAPDAAFDMVIAFGFGVAIPAAAGVAILRHGLYEIDVVINKAVVFAVLAGVFSAVYVGLVIGIGTAVGSRSNSFLTVATAVIIAVAFNPVREWARRVANRIVYGERATPYDVLSEFSTRMAGTYATEDVLPRMARIMAEGTGARRSEVWLKAGNELRRAAVWPEENGSPSTVRTRDGELPPIPDADRAVPVRHQGQLLGALAVAKAPNEPVTPVEDKLIADLAAQAGLVLRNVGLIEDLRASRQRLVAAQDEERRRLERNIHDGAQQQLVALSIKLGLLKALASKDPDQAIRLADELQEESTDALETLRDLARGVYPPLLADQGLVAALDAQVRKAALSVEIQADEVGRHGPEVEATVYFCTLEALQNVAKYAEASGAVVRLESRSDAVMFSVTDDGRGFDPDTTPMGTGLQGMADRLAALGGRLDVRSAPEQGTTVTGTVPTRPGSFAQSDSATASSR